MAITNKMKISWKSDLRESVAERDVLKLRNKLKTIQRSNELKMNGHRSNKQAMENNI